jgi:hypothetical protein
MQLSAALAFLVLGLSLGNLWIMAAAVMAWVFVQGMVRWHHRNDLLKRFPKGWPEYKQNVAEWVPRWRPWVKGGATLQLPAGHHWLRRLLTKATGLQITGTNGPARYTHTENIRGFQGLPAVLTALTHVNFLWMLGASAALIVVLAVEHLLALVRPQLDPAQ